MKANNELVNEMKAKVEALTEQYKQCSRILKANGYDENVYDQRTQISRCISALNVAIREFDELAKY